MSEDPRGDASRRRAPHDRPVLDYVLAHLLRLGIVVPRRLESLQFEVQSLSDLVRAIDTAGCLSLSPTLPARRSHLRYPFEAAATGRGTARSVG